MWRKLPLIKSVMTPFPYSVEIDTPVEEARGYMRKHRIHHLPVTDGDRLAGILGEDDVPGTRGARLSDIRFEQPLVYDLNTRLDEILRKMADGHVHTVLVTRHGKLAGIFTVTDACRHFAGFLRDEFGPPGGDEAA